MRRFAIAGAAWLLGLLPLVAASQAGAEPPERAGFTIAAELREGAYRVKGAPNVIVHAADGFDRRGPLHLVVFLHGYNGCVAVLMGEGPTRCKHGVPERDGWALGRHHDAAGTHSLFVVPQLAFLQRNSRPGNFAKRNGFRAFLEELLASDALSGALGGPRKLRDVASLTLVAHSAGYQTALSIAERGGVRSMLRALVLLDALYGETGRYARFIEAQVASPKGLRFLSLYLERGAPRQESQRLYRRLRQSLGSDAVAIEPPSWTDALARYPVVIAKGRPPHRLMPEHHLSEVLRALHDVFSTRANRPPDRDD